MQSKITSYVPNVTIFRLFVKKKKQLLHSIKLHNELMNVFSEKTWKTRTRPWPFFTCPTIWNGEGRTSRLKDTKISSSSVSDKFKILFISTFPIKQKMRKLYNALYCIVRTLIHWILTECKPVNRPC